MIGLALGTEFRVVGTPPGGLMDILGRPALLDGDHDPVQDQPVANFRLASTDLRRGCGWSARLSGQRGVTNGGPLRICPMGTLSGAGAPRFTTYTTAAEYNAAYPDAPLPTRLHFLRSYTCAGADSSTCPGGLRV